MNGFGDLHIQVGGERVYSFKDTHELTSFLLKGMSCLSLELREEKINATQS